MVMHSIFESSTSEERWITQISKILEKEVRVDINHPVFIFRVPATLSVYKPEAYVPQLIGLGPYHHFQPELYEMERCKLAAASRLQKQFNSLEFKYLVAKLNLIEQYVRACYHKYLDIEGDTLAWIMAIDGLFLLDFFSNSTTTAYLVDSTGRKLAHGSVIGDIMMLENQIPIFVLSEILSIQYSLPDVVNMLPTMLMSFCNAISPLKLKNLALSQVCAHAHVLDLLYHLIAPESVKPNEANALFGKMEDESFTKTTSADSSKFNQVFSKLWGLLSNLNVGFLSKITRPVKKILTVSGRMASSVRGVSIFDSGSKESIKPENGDSGEEKKTLIVEEIMIPSVSQLASVGVEFCPTVDGKIGSITFDQSCGRLYLPVITLNVNSEVIVVPKTRHVLWAWASHLGLGLASWVGLPIGLDPTVIMRNLVAYEASIVSEALVFTRYTELMNGIIDTVEDAKLLREKKIIINSLRSDADVAQLFNGMSKAVRLTNVPFIDKTIQDVNKYYNNTWQVRFCRRLRNVVFGSWQILTVLAIVLLMLLMGLESFCSVYSCPKHFNTTSSSSSD
ncbi:putative UPF0481 protein At3g02645 [Actinidia eriantha]|uniref:putative UPF0481 protein At3g02645 n=1 Tax=Actinidia eriantha TaxID=165200 RepID=UPI00258E7638|nr:putative UPF0481 protein At3g02645 [Actinidia eriantha]